MSQVSHERMLSEWGLSEYRNVPERGSMSTKLREHWGCQVWLQWHGQGKKEQEMKSETRVRPGCVDLSKVSGGVVCSALCFSSWNRMGCRKIPVGIGFAIIHCRENGGSIYSCSRGHAEKRFRLIHI